MRQNVIIAYLLGFQILTVFAQQNHVVPKNIRAMNFAERTNLQINPSTAGMIGIPMRSAEVIGDAYLFTDWRQSIVMLYEDDKLMENYLIRYDIQNDNLEFKFTRDVRVLKGNKVKSFVAMDSVSKTPRYFVNGMDFKDKDNVSFDGFLQVLSDGELPLFKRHEIYLKEPDFNMTLNVGNIDYKLIKKEYYFYSKNDKLYLLPNNKRSFLDIFGEDIGAISKFMKLNGVQLSQEHHLVAVFDYYNSR